MKDKSHIIKVHTTFELEIFNKTEEQAMQSAYEDIRTYLNNENLNFDIELVEVESTRQY